MDNYQFVKQATHTIDHGDNHDEVAAWLALDTLEKRKRE